MDDFRVWTFLGIGLPIRIEGISLFKKVSFVTAVGAQKTP
jgi:hypothetical protein